MNNKLKKRLYSFVWRAGLFTGLALLTYLSNVGDIREIDPYKLATIFTVTLSAYILNEGTKYLNSK